MQVCSECFKCVSTSHRTHHRRRNKSQSLTLPVGNLRVHALTLSQGAALLMVNVSPLPVISILIFAILLAQASVSNSNGELQQVHQNSAATLDSVKPPLCLQKYIRLRRREVMHGEQNRRAQRAYRARYACKRSVASAAPSTLTATQDEMPWKHYSEHRY